MERQYLAVELLAEYRAAYARYNAIQAPAAQRHAAGILQRLAQIAATILAGGNYVWE